MAGAPGAFSPCHGVHSAVTLLCSSGYTRLPGESTPSGAARRRKRVHGALSPRDVSYGHTASPLAASVWPQWSGTDGRTQLSRLPAASGGGHAGWVRKAQNVGRAGWAGQPCIHPQPAPTGSPGQGQCGAAVARRSGGMRRTHGSLEVAPHARSVVHVLVLVLRVGCVRVLVKARVVVRAPAAHLLATHPRRHMFINNLERCATASHTNCVYARA